MNFRLFICTNLVVSSFAQISSAQTTRDSSNIDRVRERTERLLSEEYNEPVFKMYERALSEYKGEIFDSVFLRSVSPIPRNCFGREGTPPLFTLTPDGIRLVREKTRDTHDIFFNVNGFLLIDTDQSGEPESYAFGYERHFSGGTYSPSDSVPFSAGMPDQLIQNFDDGITLINWQSPTLLIRVSDWTCRIEHYENGDVGAR